MKAVPDYVILLQNQEDKTACRNVAVILIWREYFLLQFSGSSDGDSTSQSKWCQWSTIIVHQNYLFNNSYSCIVTIINPRMLWNVIFMIKRWIKYLTKCNGEFSTDVPVSRKIEPTVGSFGRTNPVSLRQSAFSHFLTISLYTSPLMNWYITVSILVKSFQSIFDPNLSCSLEITATVSRPNFTLVFFVCLFIIIWSIVVTSCDGVQSN